MFNRDDVLVHLAKARHYMQATEQYAQQFDVYMRQYRLGDRLGVQHLKHLAHQAVTAHRMACQALDAVRAMEVEDRQASWQAAANANWVDVIQGQLREELGCEVPDTNAVVLHFALDSWMSNTDRWLPSDVRMPA